MGYRPIDSPDFDWRQTIPGPSSQHKRLYNTRRSLAEFQVPPSDVLAFEEISDQEIDDGSFPVHIQQGYPPKEYNTADYFSTKHRRSIPLISQAYQQPGLGPLPRPNLSFRRSILSQNQPGRTTVVVLPNKPIPR